MFENEKAEKFWQDFLKDTSRDPELRYSECFHFEMTEYWANELLRLVLEGRKMATSSSLWGYELEGDKIPQKGELSIVTDWNGDPKCVIETTAVTIIPFKDITYEICSREGEDENLQSWQDGHRAFFTEEGKELGYEFSEDMPVIFQDFRVIYRKEDVNNMEYKRLTEEMINMDLFRDFHRHQEVTKCLRKISGEWVVIDNPFTEDWGEKEFEYLVKCLKNTVNTGGVVYGAFQDTKLAGFASAESKAFGTQNQYIELSCIHVTEELRGMGIGKQLFRLIAQWAKEHGGEKLYISSHSSVESQSFYKAMGCIEAEEYSEYHVQKEPCDCQLEFLL